VYLSAKSLVEDGDLNLIDLDESFGVEEYKKNYEDVYKNIQKSREKGEKEFYSFYGIASILSEVPFYFIGFITGKIFTGVNVDYYSIFFVSLANCFITAFSCLYVFLFSFRFSGDKKVSFLIALIYGFGTMVYAYSVKSGLAEPLQGLAILGTCYHAYKYKGNKSGKDLIYAGLFAGLSILSKFYSVLLVALLFLYILFIIYSFKRLKKDIMYLVIPFMFCMIIFFICNYFRFGNILETGYSEATGEGMTSSRGLIMVDYSIINTVARGFGLLLSPGKGLLFFAPVLVLSFGSFKIFINKFRYEGILFLSLFFVFFIFFSVFTFWFGDWSWGPRYLYPVLAFLIIPISLLRLNDINIVRKLKIFLVIGILIQVPSVAMNFSDFIRFTDDAKIHTNRHFNPQFSPISGGYLQFFSGVKRIFTGSSLTYPVTYRNNPEGVEFMPSLGFTEFDKIDMSPYDRFDFWFTSTWDILGRKSIAYKFFIILVIGSGIVLTYLFWKRIKLMLN